MTNTKALLTSGNKAFSKPTVMESAITGILIAELGTLRLLSHVVITTIPWGWVCCYPCWADAGRGYMSQWLCPTRLSPLWTPTASPGCHLHFWSTSYKREVLISPSVIVHRLRKTTYLLDYWFIIKSVPRGRDTIHRARYVGRGSELPCPL